MRFAAIAALVLSLAIAGVAAAGQTPKRVAFTGKITVLRGKTITVHSTTLANGRHNLTCRIATSPQLRLGGFTLGTRAKITCSKGVLLTIKRAPIAKGSGTTVTPVSPTDQHSTTKPDPDPGVATEPGTGGVKVAPNVTGSGTITELGGGGITIGGGISCLLGNGSPSVSGFKLGDRVDYQCAGGYLTRISVAL